MHLSRLELAITCSGRSRGPQSSLSQRHPTLSSIAAVSDSFLQVAVLWAPSLSVGRVLVSMSVRAISRTRTPRSRLRAHPTNWQKSVGGRTLFSMQRLLALALWLARASWILRRLTRPYASRVYSTTQVPLPGIG